MAASSLLGVKALFFDVFGTTVDWRSTTTNALYAEAQSTLSAKREQKNLEAPLQKVSSMRLEDWGAVAQEWRQSYYTFVRYIAENPDATYKTIDEHHYDALKKLLDKWELQGLWSEEKVKSISLIWHKLNPWPDTVEGIKRLNTRFQTCSLSNGNVSLLTDMAEYANLDWTHILSAEMFGTYKPNPRVYLGAAEKVGVTPSECAMVAAHLNDLEAAKGCGFKTIYIERPQEEAWEASKVAVSKNYGWVDLWIPEEGNQGFITAASKLGAGEA